MVRTTAQRILSEAGATPGSLEALRALFTWVRDHIRYQADPRGLELLSEPARTLQKGREDCDGKATLVAALAHASGFAGQIAFRAIKVAGLRPNEFSHVYAIAHLPARVLALDATYPGTVFGWEYPRRLATMECAL